MISGLWKAVEALLLLAWDLLKLPLAIVVAGIILIIILCIGWYVYLRFIRGVKPMQGEHYRIKQDNIFKKLFWLAPRQFAIDRLNRNPEFFKYQGLILYIGDQGSGKTSSMVRDIMLMQEEYPKVKTMTNFGYKKQDMEMTHWTKMIKFNNGIQGVIVGVDEIQQWFNSKNSKTFPPEMITICTTNRKNRRAFLASAQRYYMVSKDIRTQCSEVRECHTFGGVLTVVIRRKYICDSQGEVEKKKFIGMYCWVHTDETREAYDTWRMIEQYTEVGFKDESEQFRMEPTTPKIELQIDKKALKKGSK